MQTRRITIPNQQRNPINRATYLTVVDNFKWVCSILLDFCLNSKICSKKPTKSSSISRESEDWRSRRSKRSYIWDLQGAPVALLGGSGKTKALLRNWRTWKGNFHGRDLPVNQKGGFLRAEKMGSGTFA